MPDSIQGYSGFALFVKRDCPTCQLIEPALVALARARDVVIYAQDDPEFPAGAGDVIDDRELEFSYRRDIEIVPTVIALDAGQETERAVGWSRDAWRRLTGRRWSSAASCSCMPMRSFRA